MKAFFLVPAILLALVCAAQKPPAKNPAKKPAKPPVSSDMSELLKEMQQGMGNMSAEDKAMLDSMGIKLPNAKEVGNMANFSTANTGNPSTDLLVPKLDPARIASMPSTPLSGARMPAYLQGIDQNLRSKLPPSILSKAEDLYTDLATQNARPEALAAAGVGLWAFGKTVPALLLLSRACMDDPSNDDHLNNFAAMLVMCGGEQLGIPILEYLNKKYPKNSTILNNLAHGWFGLGNLEKASLYIDSTIRLCAWHPQANQIKARIAKSKGKNDEAVQALKNAVSRMYSGEKESQLRQLNYKLKNTDIVWSRPNKPDQLGLTKFRWPEFPKNVEQSEKLEPEWEAFRHACDELMEELKQQEQSLSASFQEAYQQRAVQDLSAGKRNAHSSALFGQLVPKAEIKLRPGIDQLMLTESKYPLVEAFDKLKIQIRAARDEEEKAIKAAIDKCNCPDGEGSKGAPTALCDELNAISSKFLHTVNSQSEALLTEYYNRIRKKISELTNYQMYTEFPEKFTLSVNHAKQEWLSFLMMAKDLVSFRDKTGLCGHQPPKERSVNAALPAYEDLHCLYTSELNLYFGSIKTACSRISAELEIEFVKLGWETKMNDRDGAGFLDEFQRCTIEVSAGTGKELFGKGPLSLESGLSVTGFLEIDRNGISDAGVKAVAELSLSTDVVDTKIETEQIKTNVGPKNPSASFGGVEAKISINSGFTAERVGLLRSLSQL